MANQEKFKPSSGGLALIVGSLMRGPEKDAIVIRGAEGMQLEVSDRKVYPEGSWKRWPFFRRVI